MYFRPFIGIVNDLQLVGAYLAGKFIHRSHWKIPFFWGCEKHPPRMLACHHQDVLLRICWRSWDGKLNPPFCHHCILGEHQSSPIIAKSFFGAITGWWLNQPIWKIWSSKWVHLPQIGVKIKKYLKPPPRLLRFAISAMMLGKSESQIFSQLVVCSDLPWYKINNHKKKNKSKLTVKENLLTTPNIVVCTLNLTN